MSENKETSLEKLSPREIEIYNLKVQGLSEYMIGAKLGLSRSTVHSHIERIRKKLLSTMDKIDKSMV